MSKRAEFITIEGRNMVFDALTSSQQIASVFVSSSVIKEKRVQEILEVAKSRKIPVNQVSGDEITKLAESRNPQGVIATMVIPETPTLEQVLKEKRDVFLLLLDHIDYEQNLGAIMRTAWASGIDAVVVSPDGVHEVTPVVAKVSMGGVAYVPLIAMSMYQAAKLIHKYAVPLVGVEVDKGETIYDTNLRGPVAFLMGGEAEGVSEALQKECDLLVNIPMTEKIASLNVSVATALVVYEKVRQERFS